METIENELLTEWRNLSFSVQFIYERIKNDTGLSKPTARMAIKYGKATPNTIEILTKFFDNLKTAV